MLVVFMGNVSATGDDNTTLSQSIDEVVDHNNNEILTVKESSAGNDSGLKELENNNILKANNDNDILSSSVTVDGTTFDDIQNTINNANDGDTIILNGLYTESGSQISITKTLTFIGINGATLDGQNKNHRIFHITANNVILNNITFINAASDNDGAVYWYGVNGSIVNSSFINNTAKGGGAVHWRGVNGSIVNSSFVNNTAKGGGAVSWYGVNGSIVNSSFVNNTAYSGGSGGGAVSWYGVNGSIVNSSFVNNTASDRGGAVHWYHGVNGSIVNSSFVNNTASLYGGAVHWESSDNGSIVNSSFMNNTASDCGGAVHWYHGVNGSIVNSSFVNNTAEFYGGAVHWESSDNGSIVNSSFVNNTASDRGGAVYWVEYWEDTISNSIFIDNKCESTSLLLSDSSLTFSGGENYINAIYSDNDIIFDNVTFWNGSVVNTNDVTPIKSNQEAGINITIEIYDSNNNLVDNVTAMTNSSGQIFYDYIKLNAGQYTYKAYHPEDNYYTYIETTGSLIIKKYDIITLDKQTLYYNITQNTIKINATIQDNETKNTINSNNIKLLFICLVVIFLEFI